VQLRFASGPEFTPMPLASTASGGELSRTMLACRSVLADLDDVPTLVFDEVDAGIGGGVAEVVGRLLQSIAKHHQVLSVTHLAQVAVHAREQLRVAKQTGPAGTLASVEPLEPQARIEEVARMLGGLRITEATRRHAEEMLQNARTAGKPAGKEKGRATAPR
jgi:DNA repair protein RecN (Recombination protein N)